MNELGKRKILKEKEIEIVSLLKNSNISYREIANKFNCSTTFVSTLAKKNMIQRLNKDYSKICNYLGADYKYTKTEENGKRNKWYELSCSCGEKNIVPNFVLKRLFDKQKKYQCKECSESFDIRVGRTSIHKKKSSNTTGYIGVCVRHHRGKIYGYVSQLNHKKETIFKNRYKDTDLHNKTLIQAAVDRDIFIIEKGLLHTRNFTDSELIGNMEYLSHIEISNIKNILELKGVRK